MKPGTKRLMAVIGIAALAGVLAGCSSHGISGDYVSKAKTEVDLLQITQTGQHSFNGSLISTEYGPDFQLTHNNIAFSGSVNDGQLAFGSMLQALASISGTVNGNTITITSSSAGLFSSNGSTQTFVRSSESAYNRDVEAMKAAAPKLAAEQVAKEKQEAADAAENQAIWTEANDLSNWVNGYPTPGAALATDLENADQVIKAAKSYIGGGFYYVPWGQPAGTTPKDYYRASFTKYQTQLGKDISGLEQALTDWNAKVANSACNRQAIRYSNCKQEFDAVAKYNLMSKQLDGEITQAETKDKQQVAELAALLQQNRPRAH